MIDSHRRVRSRSLVRVVLPALALTALVSVLLLFASPRSAFAQTSPTVDYRLQNKLSTSVGTAPALTKIGPLFQRLYDRHGRRFIPQGAEVPTG